MLQLGDLIYNNFFNDSKNEWNVKTLKEISNNFDSKRKPMSSREREEHKGNYPYYGATSIIDYVDSYLFDDTYILMGEDGTVITADNSRFEKTMDIINQIVEALSKKMKNYKILEDRREAIEYAIREHKKGDVICVIGKGHEDYNDFMGHKYHFSDREEILKILNGW